MVTHAHATDAAVIEAAGVVTRRQQAAWLTCRSGLGARSRPRWRGTAVTQGRTRGRARACDDAGVGSAPGPGDGRRRSARDRRGEAELTQEQSRAACDDSDAFAQLCRDGLRVIGLLGLSDTPRAEAAGLLASLAEQDIGVRLITGDHPITATAIANELGMPVTADQVISGSEWEALSRRGQEQAVTERLVFARMSPENKVQVVETLERTGRVCAMVGDGANDAAAIRAATVGIGVAARGSDPARTAADVMLLDGRISSLLDALDEGRKLWLRVQAAVCVLLGGNAGEVLFAIIGSAITGRSPLNTRQLLLVNMLTDALPAAALAVSEPNGGNRSAGQGPDRRRCGAPSGSAARPLRPAPRWLGLWPASPVAAARIDRRAGRARRYPARSDDARLAQPASRCDRAGFTGRDGRARHHPGSQSAAGKHTAGSRRLGPSPGVGDRRNPRGRRDIAPARSAAR